MRGLVARVGALERYEPARRTARRPRLRALPRGHRTAATRRQLPPQSRRSRERSTHDTSLASRLSDTGTTSRGRARPRSLRSRRPRGATATPGRALRVFPQPGRPRDVFEKLEDAAEVHRADRHRAGGRAALPVGRRRGLRGAARARRRASGCGSARSTRTCSRIPITSSVRSRIRTPRSAARRTDHLLECVGSRARSARPRSRCGSPTAPTTPGQDDLIARRRRLLDVPARAVRGAARRSRSCWSSTSCSSPRSTRPTSPTGARPR